VVFGAPQPFALFLIEAEPTYTYEGVGTMQVGSSSPASSGSITNTSADAMIVGMAQASTTATMGTATGSFTDLTQPHVSVRCAYQIVSASAAYSTTWTVTGGTFSWNGLVVSFANSGGGGGGGGGSAGGGLLLRGVGAALWRGLWPFGGRAPILGVQVDVGAIRADHVQSQQQHDAGDVEKRREPQDVIDRLHLFSHLRSFRPERSDLSRASNIAQVRIG
jgi:hypothetical protein